MTSKSNSHKQKKHQNLFGSSALVRQVQAIFEKDIPHSSARFSERLTQNMDFSSSLKLSELDGHLRILEKKTEARVLQSVSSAPVSIDIQNTALNAAFDRVHRSILHNIEQSFDETVTQARFSLPVIKETGNLDVSAYQTFYRAQQADMSAKIQGLRSYVRDALSDTTTQMAKLALLDQTLEETIGFPLRSGLRVISKTIAHYAQALQTCLDESTQEKQHTLLAQLHHELHQLLLAELALRLQPVKGLVSALNQEVLKIND